ncbi:hypothetical protein GMA27_14250 [Turicibacter sanguinis]|nr:hypothetical protein [Turicibacter sanguinis]
MQGANMVLQLLNLVVTGLQWGGGLYASFGLIQLIQGLKNQNSGDTNSGIWTLVVEQLFVQLDLCYQA